ncbi:MAG TPA: YkvA family protein [Spirochaetia bacterium]|nr:YkvA family protein [Spirochaetia bacterium]
MILLERLKRWATSVKIDTWTLLLAYRDPLTPWYARLLAAIVVAYALSPIDLIPDFIPVLGYLDDLILVPAGIRISLKLIPAEVVARCRIEAQERQASGQPSGRAAAVVIVTIWIAAGFWIVHTIACG